MRMHPSLVTLVALVVLVSGAGSQCGRRDPQTYSYGPRILTQNPTLDEVTSAVNRNSQLIQSLYSTDATLSVAGAPTLKANLAMERQRNLRIQAETTLTGTELDLGSNNERFWMWTKRMGPPTLYHCRHDQFATSAARQLLPVDPDWLLDAVGLTTFDPAEQHTAPARGRNGHWEIRTAKQGATGPITKITVVDEARGFVLEQHLYDARGQLIASSVTSRHWRDPGTGAVVPQQVDITMPGTQFSMRLEVNQWKVNSLAGGSGQMFVMPQQPGWQIVDLGNVGGQGPNAGAPTSPFGPATGATGATSIPSTVPSLPPSGATPLPWNAGAAAQPQPGFAPGTDLLGFTPQPAPYTPPQSFAPNTSWSATGNNANSLSTPWLTPAGNTSIPATSQPGVRRY
jgi:hypothetical protein